MRLLVLGLALALVACGRPAPTDEYSSAAVGGMSAQLMKPKPSPVMMDEEVAAAATDAAASASGEPASVPSQPGAAVPAGAPMLAYEYDYALEAPARNLRGLIGSHEKACADAGPRRCQVTSSSIQELGEDRQRATLQLRATPAWLKVFRESLTTDVKAAGGKVVRSSVDSEDLSRQIVDTEARLRAMTTLRDRLLALLATRPGKLSDLVEIERELARVQGEIDSTQSQLAVMRGRVDMSILTIQYVSTGTVAPDGVWSPLVGAFTDFIGIVAFTLAAMIRLIAWLAPWVLVGAGVLWLFRKRLPRRVWPFGRKPPAAPPTDAPS